MTIYVLLVGGKDLSFWDFELLKNRLSTPILETTLLGNRGAWSRIPSLVVALNSRIFIHGFVVRVKNKNAREKEKRRGKTSYMLARCSTHLYTEGNHSVHHRCRENVPWGIRVTPSLERCCTLYIQRRRDCRSDKSLYE